MRHKLIIIQKQLFSNRLSWWDGPGGQDWTPSREGKL